MDAAEITAICTGGPALLAAIGATVVSIISAMKSTAANAKIDTHIAHVTQDVAPSNEHLMP